jgi:hypothetical protein
MSWVLRKALAVTVILAGCALASEPKLAERGLQITVAKPAATIRYDGRTVVEYRYADVPFKPYVKHLYSPLGVDVVRDMVPDHKHHHGLMFAVHAGGVDFWSETPKCGKQMQRSEIQSHSDARDGTTRTGFTESLEWVGPSQIKSILRETRQIDCYRVAELNATLLSWRSTLQTSDGHNNVSLSGATYFGMGMRFPKSMDQKGEFFTAQGKIDGSKERLTNGDWCAVYGTIDGKPITVAMFDHPGNIRKTFWFTMTRPFSYLSATLNYQRPLTLKKDQPLSLCYGVAVWDGKIDSQTIEKTSKQWLKFENQVEKTK